MNGIDWVELWAMKEVIASAIGIGLLVLLALFAGVKKIISSRSNEEQ